MNTYVNKEVLDMIKAGKMSAKYALDKAEKEIIEMVMSATRYNQSRAAKELGVSRGTMREKLKTLFGDKYISKNEKGE